MDNVAKDAKLNELKAQLDEVSTVRDQLVEQVCKVEKDTQKALANKKNRYLRELNKVKDTKKVEIKVLEKKMEDAEDRGYAEGEQA